MQQVLGIPFDVETEELKYYLQKFGELEDCIVMKVYYGFEMLPLITMFPISVHEYIVLICRIV